jgi:branched-subunit amino acid transport protein
VSWYLALVLAAAGTYAVRLASIHTFGTHAPSARTSRSLQLLALGVLAGVAVSSVPMADGRPAPSLATATALGAAVVAARLSRNVALVVVVSVVAHFIVAVALG